LQITKVEIKNIKNHAEVVFDFNPGVTAICGPNGAGKTTIIEAIAWALFDHLEYNRDDFVRRGAKRGQVDITFRSNADEREYTVHRDTGGGYYVYDVESKTKLMEQKSQVIGWLKQQIGVEASTDLSTLFKTTIGVPQGMFTADFALAPAPRKKVFDAILKVEEYREAADNLKATRNHLDTRLTETDRKIAEAEGELKAYDELRQQCDEATAKLQNLEQQLLSTTQARNQAEQQARQCADLAEQITQQRGAVEQLNIKRQLTHGNLTTAREAAQQARAAADIVAQSRSGYEQYQAATQRLTEGEKQRAMRETLRTRAAKLEQDRVAAQVQVESAKERLREVAQAKADLQDLQARVAEQEALEQRLTTLRESRGQLLGLQHAVSNLDRELDRLRNRFAELKQQLKDVAQLRATSAQTEALEAEFRALNERFTQSEIARQGVQLKREQLTQSKHELTRLQAEQTNLTNEITRLQPLAQQIRHLAEVERQQQSEVNRLAKLRAETARDAEMIAALESGGLCPLLTEKCLNLKPGEALDKRFKSGLEARRQEIVQLEKSTLALAAEVKKLRLAEAEAKRLPKLQEELKAFDERYKKQQTLVANLEADIAATQVLPETELKQLQQERQKLEIQLRDARAAQARLSQVEVLNREALSIQEEGTNKRAEREALQQKLDALSTTEAQLIEAETTLQRLGDPRGRATALQQLLRRETEWQQVCANVDVILQNLTAQLDQLNAELQSFAALDATMAEATATRAANESAYQAFLANENIAATVEAREAEAKTLTKELAATEAALNAATAQLVALEEKYAPEQHHRALTTLHELRERVTQTTTQLEHVREQHEKLTLQLAHLNEVRTGMLEVIAAHDKLAKLRSTTEFIRDTLQKAAPFITEAYLHSISVEANQLFREISGRYDLTLRWSNDYEITLEERGHQRPFANLSGGEQMAAALAVRLALLREFSDNLSLAFFDEPTTNMDEDRRRNLAQQIGRITGFKQLFVISHDDSFENFTDQVVTLGDKE
jgi:exonuclease SbcC